METNPARPAKWTPVIEQKTPGRSPRPLGPPGDPPGTPQDPPWTTKTAISQQFDRARSLDCVVQVLSLQRIAPGTPLDRFVMYTLRVEALLVGHRAAPGGWYPRNMGVGYPPMPPETFLAYMYVYTYLHICCSTFSSLSLGRHNASRLPSSGGWWHKPPAT